MKNKNNITRENANELAVEQTRNKVTVHELINFDKEPQNDVKVSVIVPVCNVEQYLRECLDSCINQTLTDIEIICVNDGSTDSCGSILREYAQMDERVKVIDKDNAGYGHTMNIGMDMARGKYIGIVESDDFVDLNMYEDLYNIAEENELELVKADFNRFYGKKGDYFLEYNKIARKNENYNIVIDPSEFDECFKFIMNTWSGIYRRDFLVSHNIRHNETPGASFQDNGFWFKTFAEAHRIMFVDHPYYMNRRDNPNSSVYNPSKVYCGADEYKYIREYLKENPEIQDKFLNAYSNKRYQTYMFTLNRIADEFKKDFLHSFSKDFREAEENGELDPRYFTKLEWETIHWIIRDPDEYYYSFYSKQVKISVILPIYNVAEYLPQCLDTLLKQSMKEFEVICIDDGSTDGCAEILYNYSMRDKRIKVYSQENKGAGTARNYGITLAKGEYLLFADSDDYFAEDMLKCAYNKITSDRADVCVFASAQYDNATGKISPCTFSLRDNQLPKKRPFNLGDMTNSMFVSLMGWAWDKLYKKSFVLNNGLLFQEQRTTNDMYFVFASLMKANRITTYTASPLYFQRRNVPTSLSNTRHLSWQCFYNALRKVRQELISMGLYESQEKNFINYALHSCLWNLNTLPPKEASLLLTKLMNEWFDELGIQDFGSEFFTNRQEYALYKQILSIQENQPELDDYEKFVTYRMAYLTERNRFLENRKTTLITTHAELDTIVTKSDEVLTAEEVVEKLNWNRAEKAKAVQSCKAAEANLAEAQKKINDLNKQLKAKTDELNKRTAELEKEKSNSKHLKAEIAKLKDKCTWLRNNWNSVQNSFSYKLGRFFTWLPRKIKGSSKK